MESPAEFSLVAKRYLVDSPLLIRMVQQRRPYICPFDRLIRQVPMHSSVLDVGCGGGLLLLFLTATGRCRYGAGIDTSTQAIESAQAMARRFGQKDPAARLDFSRIDPADVQWPDGNFEVVSLVDVMHHIPPMEQKSFFLEVVKHIGPGGRLVYKDMCRRPLWRNMANRLHDLLLARQWIHYVPIQQVEHWAAEAGLALVHSENMNRFWYGHELRVFQCR